ncbi:MAG TPA: ATP-binding protein, partial [Nevskiaceae bacterium]|nr:ATP-binding protein [Nevskiaceae bacterium]
LLYYGTLLERFRQEMPGWQAAGLLTPEGRYVIRTDVGAGDPMPQLADPESFARAVLERTSVVGSLLKRPNGLWGVAMRVPVIRQDRLLYVVTAVVSPDSFQRIVDRQGLPHDWTLSVFDADGSRIARSRDAEKWLGLPASPTLQQLMSGNKSSGIGETLTLEGSWGSTAYVRLPHSNWAVAVSIPQATILAGASRAFWLYGGGALLSILLAMLAAAIVARGINEPIQELQSVAEQLGAGGRVVPPGTRIPEIASLGAAIVAAGDLLQQSGIERAQLLDSERAARAQAEHESAIKDEFLATLSHELRTPLSAIIGWAQVLRRKECGDAERIKGVETIERNARAQAQLIDDLLDMSRVIAGKLRLDVQSVMPHAFTEAAIETVRPAAAAKNIRLEVMLDPGAGPITGDPARLQQVVWNLLSNAIKFTPGGGKVQVVVQRVASQVEICVADTGIGIAPEFLPRVWERFRQADSSTTRRHGGLGLGLAISRQLVELHGGTIEASSGGEDQGATFSVRLPLTVIRRAPSTEDMLHPRAMPLLSPAFQPIDLSGTRVLVVDDDRDARELANRLLEECKATVDLAGSGWEALRFVKERRPDVLVTDIGMPEMDGYELLRQVRLVEGDRKIPAIALTAFARSEDRTRALRAGFLVHVSKPVEPTELVAAVAAVAGRAPGPPGDA